MTKKKKKRTAGATGNALLTSATALTAYNFIAGMRARRRFMRELRGDADRASVDVYAAEGSIPEGIRVARTKEEILDALNRESDADAKNVFSKILRRVNNRILARQALKGVNAFYISGIHGDPTVAVGDGYVNRGKGDRKRNDHATAARGRHKGVRDSRGAVQDLRQA